MGLKDIGRQRIFSGSLGGRWTHYASWFMSVTKWSGILCFGAVFTIWGDVGSRRDMKVKGLWDLYSHVNSQVHFMGLGWIYLFFCLWALLLLKRVLRLIKRLSSIQILQDWGQDSDLDSLLKNISMSIFDLQGIPTCSTAIAADSSITATVTTTFPRSILGLRTESPTVYVNRVKNGRYQLMYVNFCWCSSYCC